MAEYADYYDGRGRRRSHTRRGNRRTEAGDVIVTAITIQVVVCLVLILAFIIYKKADDESYNGFKDEYSSLVNDRGRNGEVMDMFSQMADGMSEAANSFERYLAQLLGRFGGGGRAEQNAGIASSQAVLSETTRPPDASSSGEGEAQAGIRDYNYLTGDALYTSGTGMGAGGWFPVDISGKSEPQPPEGSVLTPVLISARLKPPVTGIITSSFGYRYHPVTEASDFHTGMDIASDEGTAIFAALPGLVEEVGESQIYGNYIKIRHSDKLETFYAHCSEIIAGEGILVRQGERIAKVGHTGVTTGPHLHFSVLADGLYTDPYWALKDNIKILGQ